MHNSRIDANDARRRQRVAHLLERALGESAGLAFHSKEPEGLKIRLPDQTSHSLQLLSPSESPSDDGSHPVWVFESSAPPEWDRERRSYVELRDGRVHLVLPGCVVVRDDLAPPPSPLESPKLIDPFADRSSRVVRVLLSNDAEKRWTTVELASAAGVSQATVSRATRALMRQGLVRDDAPGKGRSSKLWVPDPVRLLEAWTYEYSWRDNDGVSFHAPIGDPERFLHRLPAILERLTPEPGIRWALTLHAGASLEAPHATWDKVHLYVPREEWRSVAHGLAGEGWPAGEEGDLVLLSPRYRDSVWFRARERQGLPVVSSLQLVLDLWRYPVRGREQARHLVDTVLRPVWEGHR